jgi:hypothetical protein
MLNRCSILLSALTAVAVLVGLVLGTWQPAQAQDKSKVFHLQIALDEVREAKQDVLHVKGLPDDVQKEILGTIEAAKDAVKNCILACGEKPKYNPPTNKDDGVNPMPLRNAIKELKEAQNRVKTEQGVPDHLRAEALKLIDQAMTKCDKALDAVK